MNEITRRFRDGRLQALNRRRLARLRQTELEFLPPLLEIAETPPSPWAHWVLWILLLLVATALAWAAIGNVAIVATAPGKFVPEGRLKVVQPRASGTVKAILVHSGEFVKRGQVLVELNPSDEAADLHAARGRLTLAEARQDRLLAQLRGLEHPQQASSGPAVRDELESALLDAERATYESELNAAQARVAQARAQISAAKASISSLSSSKALLDTQLQSESQLASIGAIARDEYLDSKRKAIDVSGRLDAERENLRKLDAGLVQSRQELAQVRARHTRDLLRSLEAGTDANLKLRADDARAERALHLQWLRSPVDGIVQQIGVTSVGEVVQPSQKIAVVVPAGEPLVVEAELANQDAAFVHVGQPARIKVAAFPFERYGVIDGTVTRISPDTAATRLPAGAPPNDSAPDGGLSYTVRIRPSRNDLMIQGRPQAMRPGMVVQADIHTGRRSILSFLLDPFQRNVNEAFGVR